ncbi:tRNA (adenosine(37)-N6)-dimethylallyltransferase MiaA [Helicobacter jaachi]|uniref:tRNA dimethylallyltransferase n=1 Tax=Helicobacter jaachi TaxID=1677920 RepID=A0A4U8TAD1_9HELI|nr:tRNA (adenosine(37)-N6)-dimethylallyltransferase MiaA [Helicobacter jaachi]TLD96840.1 tRNA (adenosine(37)-N6)-dimethylallyltransferase MiaA [Helicobacter jaachi]
MHKKVIAILGASGSGKSELAHKLALEYDCEIFSLDSLSIYKYVDIASAKPTPLEQAQVRYYGLNVLEPNEKSNALLFFTLLTQALQDSKHKPLLIVGGSSFFLKSIIEGLSPMPELRAYQTWVDSIGDINAQYAYLQHIDKDYARRIDKHDTYRIYKALALFKATNTAPSAYFATHKPKALNIPLRIYSLVLDRDELRARIAKRSEEMIIKGIVPETEYILQTFGAQAQALKGIGTKECAAYLRGEIADTRTLQEQIFYHTCQLAKRQRTFNRTQFSTITHLERDALEQALRKELA